MKNNKCLFIVNRVQNGSDANSGQVIQNLMHEYLSIDSGKTVKIREDEAVKRSIKRLKPVMEEAPSSIFCEDIKKIATMLGR